MVPMLMCKFSGRLDHGFPRLKNFLHRHRAATTDERYGMHASVSSSVEWLERLWDRRTARGARAGALVATLLGGIALVEVARWIDIEWLPADFPIVHLAAISWAIGLLLFFEFIEMAFAMSNSVASSVARHLQLYALVLLRDAFLKLESFPEPISVTNDDLIKIAIMTSDAAAAIVLFLASTLFAKLQRHTPITRDQPSRQKFRGIKQVLVLVLLATLLGLAAYRGLGLVVSLPVVNIIDTYFTVLVFVDVLLALASLAFVDTPAIVFRNFGFAFAAILLRLALASPEFIRPTLGIAGAAVAIAVTLVYNLERQPHEDEAET